MTNAGQIHQNIAALEPVKRILEEADKALNDRGRTIATSDIPEVLGGIAGGAIGVGLGLTLVATSGVAGVSCSTSSCNKVIQKRRLPRAWCKRGATQMPAARARRTW